MAPVLKTGEGKPSAGSNPAPSVIHAKGPAPQPVKVSSSAAPRSEGPWTSSQLPLYAQKA